MNDNFVDSINWEAIRNKLLKYTFLYCPKLHIDPEDFVHDIITIALSKINTYDPSKSQFDTWILTIMRNHFTTTFKHNRMVNRHMPTMSIGKLIENRKDYRLPDAGVIVSELNKNISQSIQELPPHLQKVMISYFYNLDIKNRNATIGKEIGFTKHSVRTLVAVGRQKIQNRLSKIYAV